jgi:D-glycero-alpha-D-manno-heptose-7-phosphate kinase
MAMAALIARAPARLDFGGGWTDVPPYSDEQGGCVCNVAVELHAVATVSQRSDDSTAPSADSLSPDNALALAATRRAAMPNVHVHVDAEYPLGAGLGGSSAAGVAVLGALAAWRGEDVAPDCLAEDSRRLEVEDLGIAGGRQDHYAAAMGGALGLWFGGQVTARRIPLPDDVIDALNRRCVVAYTGQSRISSNTITAVMDAYRARERRVLDALDHMRDLANHMVTALESGDVDALGHLVGEHWAHQRALHPAIPTPTIDAILADAWKAGARGGKALGASGGGCVLAIAAEGREDEVRRAMAARAQLLTVRVARRGFHVVRQNEPVRAGAATPGGQ